MGNAFREPGTIISCPQQTGRKGSNMGILDDAVKKQIELQQEETKDVLTELSRDELIRRRKEDIGNELMPIILQALREFPMPCGSWGPGLFRSSAASAHFYSERSSSIWRATI